MARSPARACSTTSSKATTAPTRPSRAGMRAPGGVRPRAPSCCRAWGVSPGAGCHEPDGATTSAFSSLNPALARPSSSVLRVALSCVPQAPRRHRTRRGAPTRLRSFRNAAMKTKKLALGLLAALVVAGLAGWFSLDKETRGLLATLPTNRDVLFWSQAQRDAAFRALDRLPVLAKSRVVPAGGATMALPPGPPLNLALDVDAYMAGQRSAAL